MLQIKNISKKYTTGDLVQIALDEVSLNFRDNEFVSILGPSGSGKTTLLNIIGGLDRYDKGDLIINNVSTKKYKSRDWDSYRNHTIGFVFQSYNLIPHQSILSNVELALTISGISKNKRRKKALEALDKVGLKEQAHKKPNQMSGGQMQRVAIARALINNPDILLADEPTGALDTQTSKQVMELLREVANDRLVIMVTHNAEIAEEYSTRIVNLRDGKITGDSNPFEIDSKYTEKPKHKNLGKSSMSLLTAFSLSLNNLLTKKGRTILTAFAGSIGIIGIALILSLSTGFQNYIDKIQEDALTSYPLTIMDETADTTSILLNMVSSDEEDNGQEAGTLIENQNMANMFTSIGKNDLKSFKKYITDKKDEVSTMTTFVNYTYNIDPLIYTKDLNEKLYQTNPNKTFTSLMGEYSSSRYMSMSVFTELVDNEKMLQDTYVMLSGKLPKNYDELLIILPDEKHVSDLLLYTLGLKDGKELDDMIAKGMKGEKYESKSEPLTLTFDELMNIELKLINQTETYKYNEKYNIYESMLEDEKYMNDLYESSIPLKIVGIAKIKDSSRMGSIMSGVGYTSELIKYIIEKSSDSPIVRKQLANEDINVFSNKEFNDDDNSTGIDFNDLILVDTDLLSSAFGTKIDEKYIESLTQDYMKEISSAITADTSKAKNTFINNLDKLTTNLLKDYIKNKGTNGIAKISASDTESIVSNYFDGDEANAILEEMEKSYTIPKDVFADMYKEIIKNALDGYITMTSQSAENPSSFIANAAIEQIVSAFVTSDAVSDASQTIAQKMVEANMQKTILGKVGELTSKLMGTMANAFNVDQSKIASAFKFNLDENEIKRIFEAMSNKTSSDAKSNLISLGYQDLDEPTAIAFYFKDFTSKERFIDFLEDYNNKMQEEDEEKVIQYTDVTGVLISSVKVIVDSVSYVLIAFVSISLIVSSIMIGIITYISVLERTKEIGILRAIGASKRNISSIFNAETFIIGLFAGAIGIGISLLLLIPINKIIHALTGHTDITAVLPTSGAITLVILSVILTLIGGLIPSKKAAKKDPVLALRSE